MAATFKNYDEWQQQVPESLKRDQLWQFETYRKALFLSDLAWFDAEKLLADPRGRATAWQLVDAAGSVSANIEEGYGRGFGKDYARFLRIAAGSAKETRGWYFRGRHVFDAALVSHRLALADEIIGGLVTTSNQQRGRD
ncbi:MAG: four helix bundle protein [Caldilineales bacterium]|nr:four helix bundle protein [Caldilineales bacterium]